MLSQEWFPLYDHPEQLRLLQSKAKTKVVVAGRGSGKTERARRKLVMHAPEKKPWSNPMYFYVCPTADQGRRIAWNPLLKLFPKNWIETKNESRMFLRTIFGSEYHICSGEKPERLEGVQWDGGIVDECSDQNPDLITLSLGPAMTHRKSWLWMIGVPKRSGKGGRFFKQQFDLGLSGVSPEIESFHWQSQDILTPQEIEKWKSILSPSDYREQYEASWENATGLVFPDFSEARNVDSTCVYHPSMPIIVGSDFNVDPMSWGLMHYVNGELRQFDEIFIRGINTKATLDHLYNEYGQVHRAGWVFMGDATSRARKTSATTTDYLWIKNDSRFEPKEISYPTANPPVEDRVSAANAVILNAKGESRYKVHPKCKMTIRDFKFRAYKEYTRIIEDEKDMGHISDAVTYVMWRLFPLDVENRGNIAPIIG